MDHNNRTTQFTDPRLNTQILSSILRRQSNSNPSTTTTSTTTPIPSTSTATTTVTSAAATVVNNGAAASVPVSPRSRINETDLPQGLLNDTELLPKYRRDLVGKLRALRAELTSLQQQSGHCRLEVSRSEVFEESYRFVSDKSHRNFH